MGSDTQLPAPPLARKLARVRLFAPDTTDDADLMVAGGVYALLAETPPARFPLIASCLRGGLGQGVQGSALLGIAGRQAHHARVGRGGGVQVGVHGHL